MRALIDTSMAPEPTADDLEGLSSLYPGLWAEPRRLLSCDPVPHTADDDDDFHDHETDTVVWDLSWIVVYFVFAALWLLLLISVLWGAEDYYPRSARFVLVEEEQRDKPEA